MLNTEPRFELRVRRSGELKAFENPSDLINRIENPVENLMENPSEKGRSVLEKDPLQTRKRKIEQEYGVLLEFRDPHEGAGGFGASSAHWLMLFEVETILSGEKKDLASRLEIYKKEMSYKGGSPSGVDMIAQSLGYWQQVHVRATGRATGSDRTVTSLHEETKGMLSSLQDETKGAETSIEIETKRCEWLWPDWTLLVFRTGRKVPTHVHLSNALKIEIDPLKEIFSRAQENLLASNPIGLAGNLSEASDELFRQGLQSFESRSTCLRLRELEKTSTKAVASMGAAKLRVKTGGATNLGVKTGGATKLGVKGCGAMGEDVIIVMTELESKHVVLHEALSLGLKFVADQNRLTHGLLVEGSLDGEA